MKYIQDNINIFDECFNLDKKEINRKSILLIYDNNNFNENVISQISEKDFYKIYLSGKRKGLQYDDILNKMCEKHLIKRIENKSVRI